MGSKIAFFTATELPTTGELAAIETLKAFEASGFDICVRNSQLPNYQNAPIEDFDYIASTGLRPTDYADTGDYPAFNPASPASAPGYASTTAVVKHGQVLTGTGGSFAITVVAGVVTGGVWTPA